MLQLYVSITFILLSLLILIVLMHLYTYFSTLFVKSSEAFGTSPGTLVQLESSHVPTEEDVREYEEEQRQIQRDLLDMTGSV